MTNKALPLFYPVTLVALYLLSFIDSPLEWYSSVYMDTRYAGILIAYCLIFYISYFVSTTSATKVPQTETLLKRRPNEIILIASIFIAAFSFVSLFLFINEFPLFSDTPSLMRHKYTSSLGAFGYYPTLLFTPISIVFMITYYGRLPKLSYALGSLALLTPNILLVNRQELVMIFGCLILTIIAYYRSKLIRVTVFMSISICILAYLLGLIQIWRAGGAYFITTSLNTPFLPWIVFLSDLTGTIKLSHLVLDKVGPHGLPGYVSNHFISIFDGARTMSGAQIVQHMFSTSQTAQSIAAPFSYYAEGGIFAVVTLAGIQGALIGWIGCQIRNGQLVSRVIYIFFSILLFWTIRSGTIIFSPIFIYQALCVYSLIGGSIDGKRSNLHFAITISYLVISTISLMVALTRL